MAAGAVIGALRVVLGADTAALDKGLKDSQKGLSTFGVAVAAGMAAAAAAVAAAAYQIAGSIKSAIDSADEMNKMSQSTGIAVEELSKLKYAAELADVSSEALGKSMGKLSKALVQAGSDASSQAGRAFAAMGVEVQNQDGTLRGSADVLKDLADKFANYKDGAEKTALAIALFGKAGAAMIPLLNLGRDGLEEAADEAERYGLVLDKKTTMAAEAFNDNLKRMDKIKQGLIATMTAKMLPAFEALSATLLKSREDAGLWNAIGDALAGVLSKLATVAVTLITTWQRMFATVSSLKEAFSQLAKGDISGAWETMRKSADETTTALGGLKDTVKRLWAPDETDKAMTEMSGSVRTFEGVMLSLHETMKKTAPIVGETVTDSKNALDKFLDSQAKAVAAREAEAATVGKSVGEQERLKIAYQAQAIAAANAGINIDLYRDKIAKAGEAAAQVALRIQGLQLLEQTAMPWDQRAQQVQQYTAAMLAAGASADQVALMTAKIQFPAFTAASLAASDFRMQLDGLATTAMNGLSNALASIITGTKSAGEAFKAFAVQIIADLAAMIVKLLLFKAIRTLVFGFSEGGAVGGTGFSLTGTGGLFASGGYVSGSGTSTSDSIPAMLSNGEFVINANATKKWAPLLSAINSGKMPTFAEGGEVSGGSQSIAPASARPTIVNVGVPMITTREALRQVIDGINDMIGDGYRLNVQPA